MRAFGPAIRQYAAAIGWAAVGWVIIGWRLGYPSFWDPDEATYAEVSREMLASHSWLVPLYDGQPFFDKPPLFYVFQMAGFSTIGATELAARSVSALSALALIAAVIWFGRNIFSRDVGRTAGLMFAVLPATFALSAYAILDMTFTLFLFTGAALTTVAALNERSRLQYVGYLLLAAAVLTKGPVALALAGLAFLVSLAIAPAARAPLLKLRWGLGLLIVFALAFPWFFYMWWRFGDDFLNGYLLKENLWLYARPLYGAQRSSLFYVKVMSTGLLPWTPILIGRLVDAARGLTISTAERLLWAWTIAVVGFFSFSSFRLDHYVFPAAPALCLLSAYAWDAARNPGRQVTGTIVGIAAIPLLLVGSGVLLVPGLGRVPLELPSEIRLLPIALISAGLVTAGQIAHRWRPTRSPIAPAAGLLASYVVVVAYGLPAFEDAKPVRQLARAVASTAKPEDHVGMYRLNRWSGSWRYYVGRSSQRLDTAIELRQFFSRPGRHYCAMMRRDYDRMTSEGLRLRVLHQEFGLFTTTGRSLRSGQRDRRDEFIVATEDTGPENPGNLSPGPLPY